MGALGTFWGRPEIRLLIDPCHPFRVHTTVPARGVLCPCGRSARRSPGSVSSNGGTEPSGRPEASDKGRLRDHRVCTVCSAARTPSRGSRCCNQVGVRLPGGPECHSSLAFRATELRGGEVAYTPWNDTPPAPTWRPADPPGGFRLLTGRHAQKPPPGGAAPTWANRVSDGLQARSRNSAAFACSRMARSNPSRSQVMQWRPPAKSSQ